MEREIRRFGLVVVVLGVGLPLLLLAWSLTGDRSPEDVFGGEGNFISWLSSVQMIVIAVVAYLNASAIWHARENARGASGRSRVPGSPWLWVTFAAGFVFLSADEQLMFHEWLRDEVLAPKEMFSGKYLETGDIGLYIYMAVGCGLMALLAREQGFRSVPMRFFYAAVALAGTVVVFDAIPYDVRANQWGISGSVNQPLEEISECWAQLLFCLSFLSALQRRCVVEGVTPAAAPAGAFAPFPSPTSEESPRGESPSELATSPAESRSDDVPQA